MTTSYSMHRDRDERLDGPTYKIVVETKNGRRKVYLTINSQDGREFEVFMRTDEPSLHEFVTLVTLLTTRLLRLGVPLAEIAKEYREVHSAGESSHFVPGGGQCQSLVSRIGLEMEKHLQTYINHERSSAATPEP